ncbi:MAG TPA: copper chaperone PCu(A)C [Natronosporangium sp.]|nr:copper chaperone PCu(A)C [Natronosporangium sp.]
MTSRVRKAAAVGLLVVALAGCGAGQDSLTTETVPSMPGIDVNGPGVALRGVTIPYAPEGYPAGSTMPITMMVFNETETPVSLTSAASPVAATVTLGESPGEGVEPVGGLAVPVSGYLRTTVTLTGLRQDVQIFDIVPLELTFDNGASFELEVPMAPPQQRVGEREPILEPESH